MGPDQVTLAVDPGANGGLAWSVNGGPAATANMPDTVMDLVELLENIGEGSSVRAWLEEVGGYAGGEGAPGSAMFNFGRGYGNLEGALAALRVPVHLVRPQKWQKALGLGTKAGLTKTQWKNKLKAKAQQLHPHLKVTLSTADALLILHAAERGWV